MFTNNFLIYSTIFMSNFSVKELLLVNLSMVKINKERKRK